MKLSEFEERVKMSVSYDEYHSIIGPMYNACDVDEDEFCRLWVMMNHRRVAAYKAAAKRKKKNDRVIARLNRIHDKLVRKAKRGCNVVEEIPSDGAVKFLRNLEIVTLTDAAFTAAQILVKIQEIDETPTLGTEMVYNPQTGEFEYR